MSEVKAKMKNGCKKIHNLLQTIFDVVKISRTTPEWLAYKRDISNKVVQGLQDSILISLRYIYNSLVAKELQVCKQIVR